MRESPIRVVKHHTEHGEWELARRMPAEPLRSYLHGYQGYREAGGKPIRRKELPNGEIPLIINLGAPYRIYHPRHSPDWGEWPSFLAGLHDVHTISESTDGAYCIQVNFTPIGAHLIFRESMLDLTNGMFSFSDIGGPGADLLVEALHSLPSWEAQFDLLDSFFLERIADARLPSPETDWAWRQIQLSAGCSQIGTLAEEIGWSHKHFIARFREQVGMSPKKVARILRFKRVVQHLGEIEQPDWALIAREAGYYDQAHLVRDFRQFTGSTPAAFLATRLPDQSGFLDGDPAG
ncbi:MAG: helix-turn-helix domain-containing protein [Chloroflexota bacterium]